MRTRFSTRAAVVVLGVLAAFALRATPLGSELGRPRPHAFGAAAAALPVYGVDVSYPLDREEQPDAAPSAQLRWPAPGPITSPFGGARHHPGIDIDGVTGDPVQAAGGGTVVLAGIVPGYEGYGNLVMVDHG